MSKAIQYLDKNGTFRVESPEKTSGLAFPIAGESGLKSSLTPTLGGDSKVDQNTFLLQPVSVEELHNLRGSRNFWVLADGAPWSVTGVSAEAETLKGTEFEEQTILTAGLMWHRLDRFSPKFRLSSSVTSFVPLDELPMELTLVTVKNEGERPVKLLPVSAVPLYGRSADNIRDHRHVTSLLHRSLMTRHGLELSPTLTFDERGHRLGEKSFFAYGAEGDGTPPAAFCPAVCDFIGEGGSFTRPGALYEYDGDSPAWKKPGERCDGLELVAALRFREAELQPGEEASWLLALGVTDRESLSGTEEKVAKSYLTKERAEAALERVKRYWVEKTNIHLETVDGDFDNFMYWVSFQPTLRRLFGCSFLPYHDYGKGGRGWRDLWQDCLALLLMDPSGVRGMLVNDYRGVRFDGTNATIIGEGEGEFLADRNGIPRVWMDHGFWPWSTTELYLQQSGDLGILEEEIPYFKDALISRCEARDELWRPEQGTLLRDAEGGVVTGTVLEHILIQNLTAFYDVGEHNHMRLRGADWNDGLDMAANRGESVAFTAAYAGNYRSLAALLRRLAAGGKAEMAFHWELFALLEPKPETYEDASRKREILESYHQSCAHRISGEKRSLSLSEIADTLEGMAAWIEGHIRRTEWVSTSKGSFFNGYYDDSGRQLEGEFAGGIRMTLTGQVFPIMCGTAGEEEIRQIIAAADTLLYSPDAGGYRLNTDFHEVKTDMGRAFGFAYGHKENGAVFAHMVTMYANALYRRGFVREGYRALMSLYRQAEDFERSRQYPGLPEYFDGRGRGLYPYLTGSASWMMLTVVTRMFGARGEYGDLLLEPRLLDEQLDAQGKIGLRMEFAGIPIHICYEARERREVYTGIRELKLDGAPLEGNVVPKALLAGSKGEITAILE